MKREEQVRLQIQDWYALTKRQAKLKENDINYPDQYNLDRTTYENFLFDFYNYS